VIKRPEKYKTGHIRNLSISLSKQGVVFPKLKALITEMPGKTKQMLCLNIWDAAQGTA